MYPREDVLMPYYGGVAAEIGYNFSFGRMSAELGILYKPGRGHILDIRKMEYADENNPNPDASVDSRKNQVNGMTLRVAYEKPLNNFYLRGGLQFGALKFRQEYVADVGDGTLSSSGVPEGYSYRDTYNGVHEVGGLSISPFLGISVPIMTSHFFEANFVMLNYTAAHYNHVAGTEPGRNTYQNEHTKRDTIKENSRLIPHIEVAFGIRF